MLITVGDVELGLLHDEVAGGQHPDDLAGVVDHRAGVDPVVDQARHGVGDGLVGRRR